MNITQQVSCQQTKNNPKEIAQNSFQRAEKWFVSLFARVEYYEKNSLPMSIAKWVENYNWNHPEEEISEKTAYRHLNALIDLGLVERISVHKYKLTEQGHIVKDSGFANTLKKFYQWKRMGRIDAIKEFFLSATKQQLSNQLSSFSYCSYIEGTKDAFLNISNSLFGSFANHITKSPEERMKMNIKRRNLDVLGIKKDDFDILFSMIRRDIGFIKNKRWFDEFVECLKVASEWLNYARDVWNDGSDYFSTMWIRTLKNKRRFASADELHHLLDKIIQNNREDWERNFV